jgi:hypothetical protein
MREIQQPATARKTLLQWEQQMMLGKDNRYDHQLGKYGSTGISLKPVITMWQNEDIIKARNFWWVLNSSWVKERWSAQRPRFIDLVNPRASLESSVNICQMCERAG